jgi:hypothetical protein
LKPTLPFLAHILDCPAQNVLKNWPLIDEALKALCPNYSDNVAMAAAATVRVETGPARDKLFMPIREAGGPSYFVQHYWDNVRVREELGNLSDVDAIRYFGRGFIQITGRNNYAHFGKQIGVNLLDRPDEAYQPETAALIFAAFFQERGCVTAANARDWKLVRHHVNGGTNGLEQFLYFINQIEGAP